MFIGVLRLRKNERTPGRGGACSSRHKRLDTFCNRSYKLRVLPLSKAKSFPLFSGGASPSPTEFVRNPNIPINQNLNGKMILIDRCYRRSQRLPCAAGLLNGQGILLLYEKFAPRLDNALPAVYNRVNLTIRSLL